VHGELAGACPAVFTGFHIGSYDQTCVFAATLGKKITGDESEADGAQQRASIDFTRDHVDQLPAVLLAREGRAWSVFQPYAQTELDTVDTRFELWAARTGLYMYWVLLPLAAYGLVVLHQRGVPIYSFIGFAVIVVFITAITFGETRYRSSAEVGIVIAAAVAIDHLIDVWRRRRGATLDVDEAPASGPTIDVDAPVSMPAG
jgi:hypothetical protein